jgi:hypothetical protein
MCAKADYREGFHALVAEFRRLTNTVAARQRRSHVTNRQPRLADKVRPKTQKA